MHGLLTSLQVQLKSLTEFYNAVECITLQANPTAAKQAKSASSGGIVAATVTVARKLLSEIATSFSRSSANGASNALDARLQKLLVHVVMNTCAVEHATDLFGCLGLFDDWTRELRQLSLAISDSDGSSSSRKKVLTSYGTQSNLLRGAASGAEDYVVVWSYPGDEAPGQGDVESRVSGVVDWHTVKQVLGSGKPVSVDEANARATYRGVNEDEEEALSAVQDNNSSNVRLDLDDMSELSLDIVDDADNVDADSSSERPGKPRPLARPTPNDKMAGTAARSLPTLEVANRGLLSARSMKSVLSASSPRSRLGNNGVAIVPVTVPLMGRSGASARSPSAVAVVGAIQFIGGNSSTQRDADTVRNEIQEKFKTWMCSLGNAVFSRSQQHRIVTSAGSQSQASRFCHFNYLLNLLKLNSSLDENLLKICCVDPSVDSQGGAADIDSNDSNVDITGFQSPASLYDISCRLGEMIAGVIRADCCVLLRTNASTVSPVPMLSGSGSGNLLYGGVASLWKDGFSR
jgi:hypothetical protein